MAEIINLGPVGFNPTGNYDNTHEYEKLDVVLYKGSFYVVLKGSIGWGGIIDFAILGNDCYITNKVGNWINA